MDELSLDTDPVVNACTWMWMSASTYFFGPVEFFVCPVNFSKEIDPTGEYVR